MFSRFNTGAPYFSKETQNIWFCIRGLTQTHHNSQKQIILEPVDEWIALEDIDGINILEKFYGDQEKWSFSFQN